MGMYTEIYVNVNLKPETPEEVIEVLTAMCRRDLGSPVLAGKPSRWALLFNNGSYYVPSTSCADLTYDKISKQWSLLGKGDIKNYQQEIEQFFDWIMPHVEGDSGDFVGYSRYEESQKPELVFKP